MQKYAGKHFNEMQIYYFYGATYILSNNCNIGHLTLFTLKDYTTFKKSLTLACGHIYMDAM